MKKTKKMVLSATISAASVVVLLLGSIFTTLDLTVAAFAGMPLLIMRYELGLTSSLLSYLTTSTLGILLLPNKLAGIFFLVFFGIYPIFKRDIEMLSKIFSWVVKLIVLNLLFSATIWGGKFILVSNDPLFSFTFIPYLVANITFILYDIAMAMFYTLYIRKYKNAPFLKDLFNGR